MPTATKRRIARVYFFEAAAKALDMPVRSFRRLVLNSGLVQPSQIGSRQRYIFSETDLEALRRMK